MKALFNQSMKISSNTSFKLNTTITEEGNSRTKDLDIAESYEIVKLLSLSSLEMFGEESRTKGILDKNFLKNIENVVLDIKEAINNTLPLNKTFTIFLVGAGTSGRLCFMIADIFKNINKSNLNVIPIIAGGPKALIRAQANTEDQLLEGISDIHEFTKDLDNDTFTTIGVSCGLSAMYVRGALEMSMKKSKWNHVIIGFNPISDATIELLPPSDSQGKLYVLNPDIGSEALAGSVRMKSGTATLVLLNAILKAVGTNNSIETILHCFNQSKAVLTNILNQVEVIADLINKSGQCLKQGGSISWVGDSFFGPLCIFDSAECPPTFGSLPWQINGYSENGLCDIVSHNYLKKLSSNVSDIKEFKKVCMHGKHQKIVFFFHSKNYFLKDRNIHNLMNTKNMKAFYLNFTDKDTSKVIDNNFYLNTPTMNDFDRCLMAREVLTYLSTGAFTLAGKVMGNTMIDLRITNKKLFYRAIRIISKITECSHSDARKALLWVIWQNDEKILSKDIDSIVTQASKLSHIVPISILKITFPLLIIEEIESIINLEPNIRKVLMNKTKEKKYV